MEWPASQDEAATQSKDPCQACPRRSQDRFAERRFDCVALRLANRNIAQHDIIKLTWLKVQMAKITDRAGLHGTMNAESNWGNH